MRKGRSQYDTYTEGELASFSPFLQKTEILLADGRKFLTKALIITSGTFLASKMYTGLLESVGGRVGEPSADALSKTLSGLKVPLRRLKTGTPSRIDPDTVDFSECEVQHGDIDPWPFSDSTTHALNNDAVCCGDGGSLCECVRGMRRENVPYLMENGYAEISDSKYRVADSFFVEYLKTDFMFGYA